MIGMSNAREVLLATPTWVLLATPTHLTASEDGWGQIRDSVGSVLVRWGEITKVLVSQGTQLVVIHSTGAGQDDAVRLVVVPDVVD